MIDFFRHVDYHTWNLIYACQRFLFIQTAIPFLSTNISALKKKKKKAWKRLITWFFQTVLDCVSIYIQVPTDASRYLSFFIYNSVYKVVCDLWSPHIGLKSSWDSALLISRHWSMLSFIILIVQCLTVKCKIVFKRAALQTNIYRK